MLKLSFFLKALAVTAVTLKAWILSTMLALEPSSPYKETFDTTAAVACAERDQQPALRTKQPDGACSFTDSDKKKTAALYISIGWFEGAFQQDAKGDCDKKKPDGTCVKGSNPHSFCMFQVNESNLKGLGTTKDEILKDFSKCVAAGNQMLRSSFHVCAARPLTGRLRWYAAGGPDCATKANAAKEADVARKSEHRVNKAVWIYDHYPFPELAPPEEN